MKNNAYPCNKRIKLIFVVGNKGLPTDGDHSRYGGSHTLYHNIVGNHLSSRDKGQISS